MTYQYSDIDPLEAIYTRAMHFGLGRLATALGQRMGRQVSSVVLRHKLRPEVRTHFLTAEEFSLIVELCEGVGDPLAKMPLRALCWQHGLLAIDIPSNDEEVSVVDIMGQLGKLASEFSDVVREVTAATADRKITATERESIQTEAEQLMQAVAQLCRAVDVAAGAGGE